MKSYPVWFTTVWLQSKRVQVMNWRPAPHWIYMVHYVGQNMTTETSEPRMGENTTLQREKLSVGVALLLFA